MNEQYVYGIDSLVKRYQERQVLSIQTLQIAPGEIFALIGPSGSGKSTLLRLLNFLEAPSSGQIHFEGAIFEAGKEISLALRRRVTSVFQHPILLNRSVQENVAFGLNLRGRRNDHQAVERALQAVGLEKLAHQRARTLSGGEAQRVALARAMAINPDVLLLDEPTANLDPYNVSLIENIIRQLNQEAGVTIILVTHNTYQAKRLASRTAFLLDGCIVEVNNTEQLFKTPQDSRTKAFLAGEMIY
jgi:tungstate transport system ATP-binding protein